MYWSEADLYGEVNPQTTDYEGRYAWMTPIGNWLVKITKDGYLDADSKNDPEAVNGWLPVPPPQMNVNIALASKAAPVVETSAICSTHAQVVFSQYMDIAQFMSGNLVTVTQGGNEIPVTLTFEDAEVSPTDSNVFYGRVLKIERADGTSFVGENIEIRILADAKNYAGTTLGTTYQSGPLKVGQVVGSLSHSYPNRYVTEVSQSEEIVVQVKDIAGKPMAGVTVTAKQRLGGRWNLPRVLSVMLMEEQYLRLRELLVGTIRLFLKLVWFR